MNLRFPKEEKLKSRKEIEALIFKGKSMVKFPVKVYYLPRKGVATHQATFAVPKKNFKKAVDRNRLKRQLREGYRLHKHLLTENDGATYSMLFLYIGKEKLPYKALEPSIIFLLKRLKEYVS